MEITKESRRREAVMRAPNGKLYRLTPGGEAIEISDAISAASSCPPRITPRELASKITPRELGSKITPRELGSKITPRELGSKITPRTH